MKQFFGRVFFILLLLGFNPEIISAEEPVTLFTEMNGKWYQVERSNWSQYRNGKYIGLTHRETRTTLSADSSGAGITRFTGFCYVLEETLRDLQRSARSLDDVEKLSFSVTSDGRMKLTGNDTGYPRLRNFPLLPDTPVSKGARWEGESVRIVDPTNSGKITLMPIQVGYQFMGEEQYNNKPVYRIKARYATRINNYRRLPGGDPDLESATGTHDIDILISSETGAMVLMMDRLDETFFFADGTTVRFRGSTALFGEVPVPVDRIALVNAATPYGITGIQKEDPRADTYTSQKDTGPKAQPGTGNYNIQTDKPLPTKPGPIPAPPETKSVPAAPFMMEETEQGVRLSLRDIRFVADSAEILPEESWRIDAIAKTLRSIPDGRFLVEGHTADVGNPAGEKKLSIERAERIIQELSKRGIPEDACIYAGYGGTRPVADNRTPEGRAQNRRVEITILE